MTDNQQTAPATDLAEFEVPLRLGPSQGEQHTIVAEDEPLDASSQS
ncbi:hypothetical protein P3T36_002028 [Kitasatospora sp. MAP12-15]|nr:hypothetical protein [Kitasatospora sp. MAP12-44]MDH6111713.1 hypothetical protein [Kitasatospora sp. MAP12-44]